MSSGISAGRRSMHASYHQIWQTFCQQHRLDPHLTTCPDPVSYLQVFALRIRDGRLSASGNPVRSSTVAEALNAVAQTFTMLGRPDPRLITGSSHLDPRLTRLLKGFAKEDAPPTRVQPLPLSLLHLASDIAIAAGDVQSLAASDLMWLAFFFLLRPGEYSNAGSASHPFCISDVQLWHNSTAINITTADPTIIRNATFAILTFHVQKNNNRNEPTRKLSFRTVARYGATMEMRPSRTRGATDRIECVAGYGPFRDDPYERYFRHFP